MINTAPMTDRALLPQHRGAPVPWITRWTGEVVAKKVSVSMHVENLNLMLGYDDGYENREVSGILWLREGIARTGSPQFAQVNTYRQRAAMNRRLCQVCGSKITAPVITWLMSLHSLELGSGGTALTTSPPTCESCIPLALELCPHLPGNATILKVLEYEAWGVQGDGVRMTERSVMPVKGVRVAYDAPEADRLSVLAKQQVVKLTKFAIKEEL